MRFQLYTDGACQPNPGSGGWAFVAYPETHPQNRIIRSGYEEGTTNNRMEIKAVLEGLKFVIGAAKWVDIAKVPNDNSVTLFADSKYLLNGIQTWMHNWSTNEWKKKDGKPVLNSDLWREIYSLSEEISIQFEHIRGHSGHPENEECDRLAVAEISKNK